MKQALAFITRSLLSGLLVLVPIYLAILLLLKGMKSVVALVRPFALLLPDWLPAETVLSLLLVLTICVVTGLVVRTRAGQAARAQVERAFFEKLPGYTLVRSLTRQMAGNSRENVWKPALFETDEGLLLAFIIEEIGDGRYTVFVPSIPTPFAGAVYIVDQRRVHLLNVPFSEAVKTISKWGSGSRELVAAMEHAAGARTTSPAPAAERSV